MESRLANTWRLTVNEEKFIQNALASDCRLDGRTPLEYRKFHIKFGKDDGSAAVQLGHTHAMAVVTGHLTQPYKDRPNEGSLSIFTEFSPMADPSFEPGRPGEYAVELGRIIDRGLRESRAVDTESLCVVAGELVWAIRVDIHILDNGGNIVDAANLATLAALLTFRRPYCSFGGEDGKEVTVHPSDVTEPLPLIVHHLPIAVTFAFIGNDGKLVMDPTHMEECVMGGRMTATVNENGDICAIQKAGGYGAQQSEIMRCLRLASKTAESITKQINEAVESYNVERASRQIKRHSASHFSVDVADFSTKRIENLKIESQDSAPNQKSKSLSGEIKKQSSESINFHGGPSSWDPYSNGVDVEYLKASLASRGNVSNAENSNMTVKDLEGETEDGGNVNLVVEEALQIGEVNSLKDAVKPKHKRRKRLPT